MSIGAAAMFRRAAGRPRPTWRAQSRLKQVLTAWSLTAIGLGATIGTGMFVLTGQVAAHQAGPAVTLSLLIAAFGSGLAALCYAEFAAFLPVPGQRLQLHVRDPGRGAGLVHRLEPAARVRDVRLRGGGELVGLHGQPSARARTSTCRRVLTNAPFGRDANDHLVATGAIFNVPAVADRRRHERASVMWECARSAGANTVMVSLKVAIIVIFMIAGLQFIDTSNWHPYVPPNTGEFGHFGWSGVLQGAAIIFFSYVGFDTASTTALEARNPQRDLPIGHSRRADRSRRVLYVAMSAVITGMVPLHAARRRRARRGRSRCAPAARVARPVRQDRRHRRHDFRHSELAARPAANPAVDGRRRTAAAGDERAAIRASRLRTWPPWSPACSPP